MIDFNRIEVVCSCGCKTLLVWNAAIPGEDGQMGKYIPVDLAFFQHETRGWNCGKPDHSMKTLAGLSQKDYHNALKEANERYDRGN